jgi:hypothetical protein
MHVDLRKNAEDDIRKLRATNIPAAAAVMVALEQIEADPKAIDKLTTHGDDPAVGKDDPVRLGIKHRALTMWCTRNLERLARCHFLTPPVCHP